MYVMPAARLPDLCPGWYHAPLWPWRELCIVRALTDSADNDLGQGTTGIELARITV